MLNFKELCNTINNIACVISVEKTKDGYGDIRIVDGNELYMKSFKDDGYESAKGIKGFIPNQIYTKYIEKNLNFEEYCYRTAIKKELLHSYAYPEKFKSWFHMLYIPLSYEEDNLAYLLYIMEINDNFDDNKLSSANFDIANKVLKTTLQLSTNDDFKESLTKVISDIRKMCEASFCCILLFDDVNEKLNIIAEDRDLDSDRKNMESYIDDKFYSLVDSWKDTIGNNNCIIVSSKKGMDFIKEKNINWYNSLIKNTIDSLVLFPIKSSGKFLGYIWVSNFKSNDTVKIKETLEITTFILGSQIANYLLLNQLKTLSSIDVLTNLYNRNAMNNYMDKLMNENDKQSIGIIFLDVNGLKKINDVEGHIAGDNLIKRAAKTLKSVFSTNPIFRAGGDEFVVIVENTSILELNYYVDKIKEYASINNVSFAIGYSLKNNAKEILKALKEADVNMYEDKRKFYNSKE